MLQKQNTQKKKLKGLSLPPVFPYSPYHHINQPTRFYVPTLTYPVPPAPGGAPSSSHRTASPNLPAVQMEPNSPILPKHCLASFGVVSVFLGSWRKKKHFWNRHPFKKMRGGSLERRKKHTKITKTNRYMVILFVNPIVLWHCFHKGGPSRKLAELIIILRDLIFLVGFITLGANFSDSSFQGQKGELFPHGPAFLPFWLKSHTTSAYSNHTDIIYLYTYAYVYVYIYIYVCVYRCTIQKKKN